MAYDSTNLILQNAAIGRAHSTSGFPYGGNLWFYSSTADALTTVAGSSYFSNGYTRGMRKYDQILFASVGATLSHMLMVSAVSTGGGATAATITSSST